MSRAALRSWRYPPRHWVRRAKSFLRAFQDRRSLRDPGKRLELLFCRRRTKQKRVFRTLCDSSYNAGTHPRVKLRSAGRVNLKSAPTSLAFQRLDHVERRHAGRHVALPLRVRRQHQVVEEGPHLRLQMDDAGGVGEVYERCQACGDSNRDARPVTAPAGCRLSPGPRPRPRRCRRAPAGTGATP